MNNMKELLAPVMGLQPVGSSYAEGTLAELADMYGKLRAKVSRH